MIPLQPSNQPLYGQFNPMGSNKNNLIQQALQRFDEQYEKFTQDLLRAVQEEKGRMKSSFEEYLSQSDESEIMQHTQNQLNPAIQGFFQPLLANFAANINGSNHSNNPGNVQQPVYDHLSFQRYLNDFQIPEFIQKQLDIFKFDRPEFENRNPNSQVLVEEDRDKSLVIGQKDPNTNYFNGRAMIIYKQEPSAIYMGYMKDNMRHGRGILVIDDFKYYLGEYYNNVEWGLGEMQFINEQSLNEKYVGYFSEGIRCGSGSQALLIYPENKKVDITSVDHFYNVEHGPKLTEPQKFELNQYGNNYFEIGTSKGQQLMAINITSSHQTESQQKGQAQKVSTEPNFLQSQAVLIQQNQIDRQPLLPQYQQQGEYNIQQSYIKQIIYDQNNKK